MLENVANVPVFECEDLPEKCSADVIYHLRAKPGMDAFYSERTDRNIGWITSEEQGMLRRSVIGIAGCGGMGGLLAAIFVRLGIGEVRIADNEVFDVSNINRQFAAREDSIGFSKAIETARQMRKIASDTTILVYPQGINETTVEHFLTGCDVVCDEIEVLAVSARILLHQRARPRGISLFNCNTPGFGTYLFLYTPGSMTMEEAIGLSYEESLILHGKAEQGDQHAIDTLVDAMLGAVVPAIPEYAPNEPQADRAAFDQRFREEKKVPILATDPPFSTGFLANRVLLHLLRNSGVERNIAATPPMPGYLYIDAALMEARVVAEGWSPKGARYA